jgi:hypothetical protein
MEIKHHFKSTAHDLPALFDGVSKFSQFNSKLQKQALFDLDRYDRDKYVGDGFEFFVELFLKLHPCDNRVGIYNYSPNEGEDTGVDGFGINIIGDKSVVQVKFRSDATRVLTANNDHLSNLISAGMLNGVVYDMANPKNFRHFIFTNAAGLHHYTDEKMFGNKVSCFDYKKFKSMLDGNLIFWANASKIAKEISQ